MSQGKPGNAPEFFFDNDPCKDWRKDTITGQELRNKYSVPDNVQIFQKVPGQKDREVKNDTEVDVSQRPPVHFSTSSVDSGAGLQGKAQLLLDEDYAEMRSQGVTWEENAASRYLVLKGLLLPVGLYVQQRVDVLIQIPPNYNEDGIDMLWVSPRLDRANGQEIPRQEPYSSGNNVHHGGVEFCRWSRHWNRGYNAWRAGTDAIETILRRVTWALEHPDAG
jgi:hypothetical protein